MTSYRSLLLQLGPSSQSFFWASDFIPCWIHALPDKKGYGQSDSQMQALIHIVILCAAWRSIAALSAKSSFILYGSGTFAPFWTAGRAHMRSSHALRLGNSLMSTPAQPAAATQPQCAMSAFTMLVSSQRVTVECPNGLTIVSLFPIRYSA